MRCGASWWASRIRCTERRLTPAAFASIRPVQWVASPGGGPSVSSTTLSTLAVGSGCLPGLRVLSRVSPSMPSAMNRACHRHTTGFDLPDRRMISAHRHGHRSRSLLGTFGKVEIAVPRARLNTPDGKTMEWKSRALRAYQRRTLAADALIARTYLAGPN